tara:strand:+ start:13749 stop:14270 length:522 start_codon:yes stop_codon:yes gene_type:complete
MITSQQSGAIGGAAQGASIGTSIAPGWGTVIGGALGGVAGFFGGGGEDKAEQLAEDQARFIEMAARENRRRATLEMNQVLGGTKALTYASNLQDVGSPRRYRTALETQFRNDMAWESYRARVEADMAREGGQLVSDQISRSGVASMFGGLSVAAGAGVFGSYTKTGGYKGPFS